ncbi:hypothetical protein D3C84_923510 [compost metagenome]
MVIQHGFESLGDIFATVFPVKIGHVRQPADRHGVHAGDSIGQLVGANCQPTVSSNQGMSQAALRSASNVRVNTREVSSLALIALTNRSRGGSK